MASTKDLLELLSAIKGREPAKMIPGDREAFLADTIQRFRAASSCVSSLFSDTVRRTGGDPSAYLSYVGAPKVSIAEEWVSTYQLRETDVLDGFVDAPDKVRTAAAILPQPLSFTLDLFSEANYPGFSHPPHYLIRLECFDEPGTTLFEEAIKAAGEALLAVCQKAKSFRVTSHEGACVDIGSPADLVGAVAEAVRAIREEAARDEPDPEMRILEGLGLELVFDASSNSEDFEDAIDVTLLVYTVASRTLIQLRKQGN